MATEIGNKTGMSFRRGAQTLSVEISSAEGERVYVLKAGSKLLSLTGFYPLSRSQCTSLFLPSVAIKQRCEGPGKQLHQGTH